MTGWRVLWVGTYTPGSEPVGAGAGIHRVRLDTATGELTGGECVAETHGPSFLARHPTEPWVYAVNERAQGAVTGFAADADGRLTRLGSAATGAAAPCHVAVLPDRRHLAVANYADGSVTVHPIGPDGAPGEPVRRLTHEGSGPETDRQEGPHAHSTAMAPLGRHLLVADLGTDELRRYAIDPRDGAPRAAASAGTVADGKGTPDPALADTEPGADGAAGAAKPASVSIALPSGSGPRHMAAHPSGHLYVVGELDSQVHVLRWDDAAATAFPVATVATTSRSTSDGEGPRNLPAEVVLSSDCRFLYVSNRGADTIATFSVSRDGSGLRHLADTPVGQWPRHFAMAGGFLVVAGQNSGDLTTLRVPPNGVPEPTGHRLPLPDAVCVLPFWPIEPASLPGASEG